MSRIGNKPIEIPAGVTVTVADRTVTVQGPKGTLTYDHRPEIDVSVEDNLVVAKRQDDEKLSKAYHGLTRSLIANMVIGVTEGYKKELDIIGVGWNGDVKGNKISLNIGYADTRVVEIPMGIDVTVKSQRITITGIEKQKVGQLAAMIRMQRKPEPYNGKGIKYHDEVIVRKEGKAFGSGA